jgi:hypothetical protein
MRNWAFRTGAGSAGFLAFLLISLGSAHAQRGGVLVLSGSTNATSYEPLIIPSLRHSAFGPDPMQEAAGIATPGSGVVTGGGQAVAPVSPAPLEPVPPAPIESATGSVTSSVAGFPISAPLVPSGLENQAVSQDQPAVITPPPPPIGYPPFIGNSPVGTVPTPTTPATTTAAPFGSTPGVATSPPLSGLPPALPGGQPGLSSGIGVAGPRTAAPPVFTRAPGSRF